MNTHTPGPWTWGDGWKVPDEIGTVYYNDGENPAIEKYMDLRLIGAGGKPIIPVRIDHHEPIYDGKPITKANRDLIAAAPELLAAVDLALHVYQSATDPINFSAGFGPVADKLRAAIAKAEGR